MKKKISILTMGFVFFGFGAQAGTDDDLWGALHDQFLLTEEAVAHFDSAIEKGATVTQLIQENPGDQNLYSRILALRALHESLVGEIQSKLLLQFTSENNSSSRMGGLELHVRAKTDKFRRAKDAEAGSFDFAISDILEFARKYDQTNGIQLESLSSPVSLERLKKWREAFRKRGSSAHHQKGLAKLRSWISRESLGLQNGLIEGLDLERGSLNPNLKVYPSTTSSGNLTGNGYPMGTWSLTFDDGPAATTGEVIENLKTHGLKASFFALTSQLDQSSAFRARALQELQEGHDVFSHSYNHLQISKLGAAARKHEIEDAIQGLAEVIGSRPEFFRLPYGAGVSIPAVRTDLMKSCMVHVFWNVDTLDWHDRDPDLITRRAISQMKTLGRGIILFHDIHAQSVIASERVMSYLVENRLNTVRVSDYVNDANTGQKWGCKLGW